MKILLVAPSLTDEQGRPLKYRRAFLPPLSLAILDGLTPAEHEVRVVNDISEEIDFSAAYDLVGITAMTCQAIRAYQIADRFRKLGVSVVLGGVHPTVLPDEAKQHADSVVIGEAENIWEQVLSDFAAGVAQDFYQGTSLPDLHKPLIPRWNHTNLRSYLVPFGSRLPMMPIFTSRGCPFGCEFCSVTHIHGKTYRHKPVGNVLAELDALGEADALSFVDDNIVFDVDYATELFTALRGRDLRWLSQASTTILKTPRLIDLASEAGCIRLFIGIESVNQANLRSVKKGFNKVHQYRELFARLQRVGISPVASIIFGLDEDTPEVFQQTYELLNACKVAHVAFFLLTPYPGTRLAQRLQEEGRILHSNWSLFDGSHLVIQPKKMTTDELEESYWQTYQKMYSLKNVLQRIVQLTALSRSPLRALIVEPTYQLYFRHAVRSREHPFCAGVGTPRSIDSLQGR